MMITFKQLTLTSLATAVLTLAACGGGGSSDSGTSSSSSSSSGSNTATKTSPSVVTGKFVDANNQPIAGAVLTVEVSARFGANAFTATTDQNGDWSLDLGTSISFPSLFAGVIKKTGYQPTPIMFRSKDGRVNSEVYNESANATSESYVEITDGERVIHLGDSNFSGSANSQLQVNSIGYNRNWFVKLPSKRLMASYDNLCFYFLARGVQTSFGNPNYFSFASSTTVRKLLSDSPDNGDFGWQKICFSTPDIILLIGSPNFQINSGALTASAKYDDFEVVNFTGRLEVKNTKTEVMPIIKRFDSNSGDVATGFNTLQKVVSLRLSGGFYPVGTTKFVWNFGDATATVTAVVAGYAVDQAAGSSYVGHTYQRAGNYTIRVSYQDASGKELGFSTQAVTVL